MTREEPPARYSFPGMGNNSVPAFFYRTTFVNQHTSIEIADQQ